MIILDNRASNKSFKIPPSFTSESIYSMLLQSGLTEKNDTAEERERKKASMEISMDCVIRNRDNSIQKKFSTVELTNLMATVDCGISQWIKFLNRAALLLKLEIKEKNLELNWPASVSFPKA